MEKSFKLIKAVGKRKGFIITLEREYQDKIATYFRVGYAGCGHYFKTQIEANDYIFERWGIDLPLYPNRGITA